MKKNYASTSGSRTFYSDEILDWAFLPEIMQYEVRTTKGLYRLSEKEAIDMGMSWMNQPIPEKKEPDYRSLYEFAKKSLREKEEALQLLAAKFKELSNDQ